MTQLSFTLISNPPPGSDSTRCVGAYDQPNSGAFDEGALNACGKPKSRGLRDASAAAASLAARSNSPAQSMVGWLGLATSPGGAGWGSTGVEGVGFGCRDRGDLGSRFLAEPSGAVIVGAMNTH
jgi:hypothetical protein